MNEPGRAAYFALLGTSTLGTLSSNIISAPISAIAFELDASASQIVFAVSAFTIAMVLFAPVAGWMCERYGPRRVLLASLVLMVLAQVGASLSDTIWLLVAMRAGQGVACSAIPPAVQQTLGAFWTGHRGRVMAAWASAIGIGQAVGPPLGGVVADAFGWRAIFLTHAGLSVVMLSAIRGLVPAVAPGRPPLHVSGMASLIVGVGSLVVAFTLAGQDGPFAIQAGLIAAGLILLLLYGRLTRSSPQALVDPKVLVEVRYLRSTAAAASVMSALGVVVVTVPLFLGNEIGLSPGPIGAITITLAASMTLFAPISSRIADRITPRRVLHIGLIALVIGPLLLALASSDHWPETRVIAITVTLVVIGCGIGAVQSVAALGVMRSPAATRGSALGIHNMMRFTGLAAGYAWVAATYTHGNLYLVYAGPTFLAAATFLLTMIGPPAPPIEDRAPTTGTS